MEALSRGVLSFGALNDASPAGPAPLPTGFDTRNEFLNVQPDIPEAYVIGIGGTFVATLTFQVSVNGVAWFPVAVTPVAGGADVITATAPGAFRLSNRAGLQFRVQCTAYTSGAALVQIIELHDTFKD